MKIKDELHSREVHSKECFMLCADMHHLSSGCGVSLCVGAVCCGVCR